jgi:hypothetical protein
MRDALIPIILTALVLPCVPLASGSALAQTAPSFTAAGTDAQQVTTFLKCLQTSVAIDNRLKVASLIQYPLKAWVDGQETVIETESEFHARYSRIFDAGLKKAIADARVDTLVVNQQGVTFDNGRIWFRPVADRKNAIKIVSINEPAQTR